MGDHATGTDGFSQAHTLAVRVFPSLHKVLVSLEVGPLVDHEAAILHPAGVAAAQKRGELRAVATGLIGTTLEVPVLEEDDLKETN